MTLLRLRLGELGGFRISVTLELFTRSFYLSFNDGKPGGCLMCHILSAQAKLFSLYPFGPFSSVFSLSLHFYCATCQRRLCAMNNAL